MRVRSLIAPLAIVLTGFTVAATAQDGPAPAGRYELTSGPDSSFVRLDTRTGAVSHCRQESGVWHCEPIIDSGLADKLAALSDEVARLSGELDRLSLRVDAPAAGSATLPPVSVAGKNGSKPTGFAQAAVYRLMEMIRTLKHGRADQT